MGVWWTNYQGLRCRTEAPLPETHKLFCRSAAVSGRPHRTEAPELTEAGLCFTVNVRTVQCESRKHGMSWMGAAEDGRAPTQELLCIWSILFDEGNY